MKLLIKNHTILMKQLKLLQGIFFKFINTCLEFVLSQQSDFLIHVVLLTLERNNVIDLTVPWAYDYFAFLIPVAEEMANIDSVVKPFQWPI
jgi:hypothetical protein